MVNVFFRFFATGLAAVSFCATAQDAVPKQQEFPPKSGNGRVVVLISGQTGMANYATTA